MDAAGHDGFDEGADVFILYCSLPRYFVESSSVRTITVISFIDQINTVMILPGDHIHLPGHKWDNQACN